MGATTQRIQLVSGDYLKQNTPMSDNINLDQIESNVMEAQEIYIEGHIGTPLYNEVCSKINDNSITASTAYTTLVQDYIQPALKWSTLYMSLPFIWIKPTNKSMVKQNSEYSTSIELGEMTYLRNIYKEYMDERLTRLYDYLVDNNSTFPLFSSGGSGINDKIANDDTDFGIVFD